MKGINLLCIYSFSVTGLWALFACNSSSEEAPPQPNSGKPDPKKEMVATIQMKFQPGYQFIYSESKVKDRNFYWTTLIEQDAKARQAVSQDQALSDFLSIAGQRVRNAVGSPTWQAAQYAQALKFTTAEKTALLAAVKNTVNTSSGAFETVNQKQIAPSGAFNRFRSTTDAGRVHQLIVSQMIDGINGIIDTYAAGIAPLYPGLDRVSYNVNSADYKAKLRNLVKEIDVKSPQYTLFYQPFLDFALSVLQLNRRDEAGAFVPLKEGENQAAYQAISNISWNDYAYAMIAVLGDAPNSPGDLANISLGSMKRADHAVTLFRRGLAPILAFTGANLAPFQSQYYEAIEIKKYVMKKYNIPASKILVDPHARHTTTNMRNLGRLMYRYGIPENKKALVSTTRRQSSYVASNQFKARCSKDLGYIPMQVHERISDRDLAFTPDIQVLYLDSSDPLDP